MPLEGAGATPFLDDLAGQATWILPWIWIPLLVVLFAGLRTGPRDARRWLLVCLGAGPILGFTFLTMLGERGHPHWQAPGYFMLLPILGGGHRPAPGRRPARTDTDVACGLWRGLRARGRGPRGPRSQRLGAEARPRPPGQGRSDGRPPGLGAGGGADPGLGLPEARNPRGRVTLGRRRQAGAGPGARHRRHLRGRGLARLRLRRRPGCPSGQGRRARGAAAIRRRGPASLCTLSSAG